MDTNHNNDDETMLVVNCLLLNLVCLNIFSICHFHSKGCNFSQTGSKFQSMFS